MKETKITTKHQTTIPQEIRKFLCTKPGDEVEWCIVKGMVIVDSAKKIKSPVNFLTSQITLDVDAVDIIKKSEDDFK